MSETTSDTFEEFKNSFAYGSRTDLSFKFIKNLSNDDAARFFQEILLKIGELFDGAPPERLIDLAHEWQVAAYRPKEGASRPFAYEDRPFAAPVKPVADMTVGLVTSSGHYVDGDDPNPFDVEGMTQDEAIERIDEFLRSNPELTEIPRDTPAAALRVRHPGYDIRSAQRDPAVAFPIEALRRAEANGSIGRLSTTAYSFVGAAAQGRVRREAPQWVRRWKADGIEAVLLVPV